MTFPDTPEARREIDRQLDPDNFIEEDSCRTRGDLTDVARIIIRSIDAMNVAEKQSVCDALEGNRFTTGDIILLWSIGSNL